MDNIISEIIKIENQAQIISKEANLEKNQLNQKLNDFYAQIDRKMKVSTEESIQSLRESAEKKENEEMKKTQAAFQKRMDSLDMQYEANRKKWVSEMVQKIVGKSQ